MLNDARVRFEQDCEPGLPRVNAANRIYEAGRIMSVFATISHRHLFFCSTRRSSAATEKW